MPVHVFPRILLLHTCFGDEISFTKTSAGNLANLVSIWPKTRNTIKASKRRDNKIKAKYSSNNSGEFT